MWNEKLHLWTLPIFGIHNRRQSIGLHQVGFDDGRVISPVTCSGWISVTISVLMGMHSKQFAPLAYIIIHTSLLVRSSVTFVRYLFVGDFDKSHITKDRWCVGNGSTDNYSCTSNDYKRICHHCGGSNHSEDNRKSSIFYNTSYVLGTWCWCCCYNKSKKLSVISRWKTFIQDVDSELPWGCTSFMNVLCLSSVLNFNNRVGRLNI